MYKNWIAKYYDGVGNEVTHTEKFFNRTEGEAEKEAIGLMPDNCEDWSLTPLIKKDSLKISIDQESVDIYVDYGETEEPVHVCYWHLDEVKEDAEVMISIANAIRLFYTNPKELFELTYGVVFFEEEEIKYTVKYWKNQADYDKGEAKVISEDLTQVQGLIAMKGLDELSYAYEMFETESGQTYYHSME
jgi:hypothetical protein